MGASFLWWKDLGWTNILILTLLSIARIFDTQLIWNQFCWSQSKGIRKGITMKFELSICVFNTIDNHFIVVNICLEPSNTVPIACSFCRFFLQYHWQCRYWYLKYLSVTILLSFAGTADSVFYDIFFVILKIRSEA